MHLPVCYAAKKMWVKPFDTWRFMLDYVPDCYKTQKACENYVFRRPYM